MAESLASVLSRLVVVLSLLGWRVVLPALRRVMSLERLLRLTASPRSRSRDRAREDFTIRAAGRLWRDNEAPCLERSVALHRLLGRGGARPELVLGMATNHTGHAWVEIEAHPAGERFDVRDRFVEVTRFSSEGVMVR